MKRSGKNEDSKGVIDTLVASCFLGAFPPVDLRAVCLVRAISPVDEKDESLFIESQKWD